MRFKAEVRVTLKRGVLDPEGAAVEGALRSMGYTGVEAVRVGKLVELWVEAGSEAAARQLVEEAGRRLLANPMLETFTFTLEPADDAPAAGTGPGAAGPVPAAQAGTEVAG